MNNGNGCEPGREPIVAREFTKCRNNFCDIESAVEQIRQKLDPVLAPTSPAPPVAGHGVPAREAMPPLAEVLQVLNERIIEISLQLRDIYNRIEV